MKKPFVLELYEDDAGEYRWTLKRRAGGKTTADSGEGYSRRGDLARAAGRLPLDWSRVEVKIPPAWRVMVFHR